MANQPVTMPNLSQLKKAMPGVYEDIVKLQQSHNNMLKSLGGFADPVAEGGIIVTGANGVIDVQIVDKHPEVGEDYFLERDTQASFASAHTIPLSAVRNYRDSTVAGLTTYWRWYKSTKLGGISDRITFGAPTGITPGQLSTTASGPTQGPTQGSGQSQIPGYGYGSPSQGARQRTFV